MSFDLEAEALTAAPPQRLLIDDLSTYVGKIFRHQDSLDHIDSCSHRHPQLRDNIVQIYGKCGGSMDQLEIKNFYQIFIYKN